MSTPWKIVNPGRPDVHLEERVGRSEFRQVSKIATFGIVELEKIVAALNGGAINAALLAALKVCEPVLRHDGERTLKVRRLGLLDPPVRKAKNKASA